MTSHTFWKKDYLKKVRDFFSKNMIGGNTREESSIRLQKQAHLKKESHELEGEDGAYVSKPGTNACMASNHKSLRICFLESLQEETLMHSNKIGDEERIIVDDSKESRF
jgi:hypothetical protein